MKPEAFVFVDRREVGAIWKMTSVEVLERFADQRAAKRRDPRYTEVLPGEMPPACRACGADLARTYQYGSAWATSEDGLCVRRCGCASLHHDVFVEVAAAAIERGTPVLGATRLAVLWAEAAALELGRRFPASKADQPKRVT